MMFRYIKTPVRSKQPKKSTAVFDYVRAITPVSRSATIENYCDLVTLSLGVPGIKASGLKVHLVDDRLLTISGLRAYGGRTRCFMRHFLLDERIVDSSKLLANLSNGVLVVVAPKISHVEQNKVRNDSVQKSHDEEEEEKKKDKSSMEIEEE
eukprot:CAMPEP_0202462040 /NCGR_PEP_ID=MMETSP1360-20130828/52120_1 /ASSEMBLY_ACC=CAM_ASM_000848 /TAXON_ID=515479 /ORGANISM="Licmophora paradoxa, Strain CCMP2313" /LENGTH=151 /DNA_ID=CAMNT_0049084335 /DNA_START=67 /DNA_END=519 /DNA_ORIENTATION=+